MHMQSMIMIIIIIIISLLLAVAVAVRLPGVRAGDLVDLASWTLLA